MICVSLPDKTPAYPSHHAVINLYLYVRQFLEILCLHLNKLIFPSQQLPLQSPQWVLYPDIDLALFHLGGTRIMGLLLTLDAEQGVEAINIIQPRELIPIHYNDYEVFKSSLEEFKQAVAAAGESCPVFKSRRNI